MKNWKYIVVMTNYEFNRIEEYLTTEKLLFQNDIHQRNLYYVEDLTRFQIDHLKWLGLQIFRSIEREWVTNE